MAKTLRELCLIDIDSMTNPKAERNQEWEWEYVTDPNAIVAKDWEVLCGNNPGDYRSARDYASRVGLCVNEEFANGKVYRRKVPKTNLTAKEEKPISSKSAKVIIGQCFLLLQQLEPAEAGEWEPITDPNEIIQESWQTKVEDKWFPARPAGGRIGQEVGGFAIRHDFYRKPKIGIATTHHQLFSLLQQLMTALPPDFEVGESEASSKEYINQGYENDNV